MGLNMLHPSNGFGEMRTSWWNQILLSQNLSGDCRVVLVAVAGSSLLKKYSYAYVWWRIIGRNSVTDNLRGLYGTRLENLLALKSRDIPRAHGRGRELLLQILNCCD